MNRLKAGSVYLRKDGRWCAKYRHHGKVYYWYATSAFEARVKMTEGVQVLLGFRKGQNVDTRWRDVVGRAQMLGDLKLLAALSAFAKAVQNVA